MTEPRRMRAGDSDRQAAVDRLTAHFTDGRLDANEYDERVGKAYAAVYSDQFAELFTDLPDDRPGRPNFADAFGAAGFGTATEDTGRSGRPGGPRWAGGPPWARGRRRPPRILPILAVLAVVFVIGAVVNGLFFFPFPLLWIVVAVMLFSRGGGCHGRWANSGPGNRGYGQRR